MARSQMRSFGVSERVGHHSNKFYNRKLYDKMHKPLKYNLTENILPKSHLNKIYVHSSESMSEIPDNSIHLIVTSPPYNVGKDYDEDLTMNEYRDMLYRVWQESYRVLVDGGRICINIANIGRKPYIPFNTMITSDMLNIGFLMRGEVIWNKSASAGTSCAWGSWMSPSNPVLRDVHEYIMIYCKGDFMRKKPDRDSEKRSTINREDFLEWTKSIWNFPSESAKKIGHPAPYPIELPTRFINLYTFSKDIVLDPFIGSGTTALAAQQTGRYWIGYEISQKYVDLTYQRLRQE